MRRLYELKGRDEIQPTALVVDSVDMLLGLRARAARPRGADRAGAPAGAATRSSCRTRRDAFAGSPGARPTRSASASRLLEGEAQRAPRRGSARWSRRARTCRAARIRRRLDEVPEEIRAAVDAIVDVGPLPGHALDRDRLHRPGAGGAARGRRPDRGSTPARRVGALASSHPAAEEDQAWPSPRKRSTTFEPPASPTSIRKSLSLLGRELERQRGADRADRVRELHLAERARGRRLGADEQVRRGLSRPAATTAAARSSTRSSSWRSIAPRSCSAPSTRTSSRTPARRRTWPRTSRCLQPGDTILGAPARPRRAPHARAEGQLLGPALHDRLIRRLAPDGHGRLRRGARASPRSTGRS